MQISIMAATAQTLYTIAEGTTVSANFNGGFFLYVSKYVLTIALSLNIYRYMSNGLNLMKYVNNHPNRF